MLNVNRSSKSDIIKTTSAVSEEGKGRETYEWLVVWNYLITFAFHYWCSSGMCHPFNYFSSYETHRNSGCSRAKQLIQNRGWHLVLVLSSSLFLKVDLVIFAICVYIFLLLTLHLNSFEVVQFSWILLHVSPDFDNAFWVCKLGFSVTDLLEISWNNLFWLALQRVLF